jgi:hypothetical protein
VKKILLTVVKKESIFYRIRTVPVCREERDNILDPLLVIPMLQSSEMRMDMCVVAMCCWCPRGVRMRDLLNRVWQMCYFFLPDGCEYFIMGLDLVDPDHPSPKFTAWVVVDQHAVAPEFPADRGARGINCARKTRAFGILPHEYAPFLGRVLLPAPVLIDKIL